MPAAISNNEGANCRQDKPTSRRPGARPSRSLLQTAITTGSVPMIIVGSGPPACAIALARNR